VVAPRHSPALPGGSWRACTRSKRARQWLDDPYQIFQPVQERRVIALVIYVVRDSIALIYRPSH
jgi:hypothetical protein